MASEGDLPHIPLSEDAHAGLDVLEALGQGLSLDELTLEELRTMNIARAWIRDLHAERWRESYRKVSGMLNRKPPE